MKGLTRVKLPGGRVRRAEVHWYESHGIGRKNVKIKRFLPEQPTKKRPALVRFALCIDNEDCVDLVLAKVYRLLPDREASSEGFVRVIDESGEDYLYPAEQFRILRLPATIAARLELPDQLLQRPGGRGRAQRAPEQGP